MNKLLKISTLGGLSIQLDQLAIEGFVSRKAEALLVYLACNRNEHPREALAELFWADLPQERSLANLRNILFSLQQQLAPYLIVNRKAIRIQPEANIWLDVRELERRIDEAERFWRSTTTPLTWTAATQLETALALYQGDFLLGFPIREAPGFENWMLLEQERLRQRTITAFYRLAQHFAEKEVFTDAISQLNKLLQIESTWEDAHRQLMLLLARSGQMTAALNQYEVCRYLLKKELDVEPCKETTDLYTLILNGEIETPARPPVLEHNLPMPSTPFVDRPHELSQIREKLADPKCRLITLVGTGGIGKTRLALETGAGYMRSHNRGVCFVPLVSINSAAEIPEAIARGLKLPLTGDQAEKVVIHSLYDKKMLLILDNFEHLMDGAEFVDKLVNNTQHLQILLTSRERLNLNEEWLIPVKGLPVPKTVAGIKPEDYGAVQLFVQRVRQIQPEFTLEGHENAVIQICQLVEGLPLGIELASSWLRVMSCEQVVTHIERDINFLSTSLRNIPERHRNVRVLFDYSLSLLTENERLALMKLSVFRGEFTLEAAQAVANITLPILLSLIEKCLVNVEDGKFYHLHELLRRYITERLVETGLAEATCQAHWNYYFGRITGRNKPDFKVDYPNIIAALEWADQNTSPDKLMQLAAQMVNHWLPAGYYREGWYWLNKAYQKLQPDLESELRASVLHGLGQMSSRQGDYQEAYHYLQAAYPLYQQAGNQSKTGHTLTLIGYAQLNLGKFDEARQCHEQVLAIGRELDDKNLIISGLTHLGTLALQLCDWQTAQVYIKEALIMNKSLDNPLREASLLNNMGLIMSEMKDFASAKAYHEEAMAIFKAHRELPNAALTMGHLGGVLHDMGDHEQALRCFMESLKIFHEIGDKMQLLGALESFACLAVEQEEPERAATLFGAVETARIVFHLPLHPREEEIHNLYVDRLKQMIDTFAVAKLWDKGSDMSLDEAVAYILLG